MDWVSQLKTTLLPQHHQGDRRYWLSHRINTENSIVAHRLIALSVHQADRIEISGNTVSRYQDLTARYFAGVDIVFSQVCANSC